MGEMGEEDPIKYITQGPEELKATWRGLLMQQLSRRIILLPAKKWILQVEFH